MFKIKNIKKIAITSLIFSVINITSAQAVSVTALLAVAKPALELLNKVTGALEEKGTISISNTDIKNTVKLLNTTLVVTNVGIDIKGKHVKIDNSLLENKVSLFKTNAYFTNLGIKISSNGTINIANSNLINNVVAVGSTIVGGNAGINIRN